jgi:predicted alpha/beta hydrolase family esterase
MSDFRIIFIHGYTASHLADWYPDISVELDKLGIDYAIPDMPGGAYPHAEEWLDTLHNEVVKSTKPLVLVGHSLGTRTALLYLEKYQPKNVQAVFLIAAFANRLENADEALRHGETYPDFFVHKIDIPKVKKMAEKFIIMHSKDDSSIPYEQGVEISKELGAQLVTFEDRDHFSKSENASFILKELQKVLQF